MPGHWTVAVGRSLGHPQGSLVRERSGLGPVRGPIVPSLRGTGCELHNRKWKPHSRDLLLESLLFLFPVSSFSCLLPDSMLFFFLLFSLYTYSLEIIYGLFFFAVASI